jgi:hypothetical protein
MRDVLLHIIRDVNRWLRIDLVRPDAKLAPIGVGYPSRLVVFLSSVKLKLAEPPSLVVLREVFVILL